MFILLSLYFISVIVAYISIYIHSKCDPHEYEERNEPECVVKMCLIPFVNILIGIFAMSLSVAIVYPIISSKIKTIINNIFKVLAKPLIPKRK